MAIPLNEFTPDPVISAYVPPLTDTYNPLSMRATGGVAIGDGSQGREVQFWTCEWDGDNLNVFDSGDTLQFQLEVGPGIHSCCLAFDSNMAVVLCWLKDEGAYLYFFNSLTEQYETDFHAGITSCRVTVDKTTQFFNGQSDVIFGYVVNGTTVHYRVQRDRYAIEYDIQSQAAPTITLDNPLIRLGPSEANRLQFEFYVPPPPPGPIVPLYQAIKPTLSLQRLIDIESTFD